MAAPSPTLVEASSVNKSAETGRDPSFDIARGIGILFVLIHHWSGSAGRLFTEPKGTNSFAFKLLNSLTTFTVPTFLLISCILAANSLAKDASPLPFYRRRLPGLIYPLVVWTLIVWGLTLIQNPAARHLHNGIPMFFMHPLARLNDLLWGKAMFHFYFLAVLIQVMLIMPAFFYPPLRQAIVKLYERSKSHPSLISYAAVVTWLILQASFQALQHYVLKFPYPASLFIWYSSAWWLAVPMSLVYRSGESPFAKERMHFLPLFGFLAVITYLNTLFFPVAKGDWFTENANLAMYCGFASMFIVFLGTKLRDSKVQNPLVWLGRNSLQIYLIHPFLLELLGSSRVAHRLSIAGLGPLLELALMVGGTLALVIGIKALKAERILFGRAV